MTIRRLIFSPESLLALLTHYTQGVVPMDAKLLGVYGSDKLDRVVALEVQSAQWADEVEESQQTAGVLQPLVVRYEGKKTLTWGGKHQELKWTDSVEGPKRT